MSSVPIFFVYYLPVGCGSPRWALAPILYATSEFLYASADPNDMVFKRAGCIDVGLQCGGWGHVVMEVRVEEI